MTEKDYEALKDLVKKYGFTVVLFNMQRIASLWAEESEERYTRAYYTSVAGGLEESAVNLGSGLV